MSAEAQPVVSRSVPPAERAGPFTLGLWVLAGVGMITFLIGVAGENSQRAWQAYLVNWLFWSGLALSGLTFSAILQVTKAQWAGPVRQLAEALAAFLPFSFFLFIVLFLGSEQLFSWILDPVPAKQAWLNKPFLILRNLFGLVVLYGCGFALLRASLQASGSLAARYAAGALPGVFALFVSQEKAADTEGGKRQLTVLSPIFILLYAIVFSLFAFDLVMSLEPHWLSTLFGAYFCIGNMYAGLSLLAILAALMRSSISSSVRQVRQVRQVHRIQLFFLLNALTTSASFSLAFVSYGRICSGVSTYRFGMAISRRRPVFSSSDCLMSRGHR